MIKHFFSLFLAAFLICTMHASQKKFSKKTNCVNYPQARLKQRAKLSITEQEAIDKNFEDSLQGYFGHKSSLNTVEQFLQKGANPDKCVYITPTKNTAVHQNNTHMGSPLYIACKRKKISLSKILLKHGAYPNSTDSFSSPLHASVLNGNFDDVQLLLNAHADPNEQLFLLRQSSLLEATLDQNIQKLLIESGAKIPKFYTPYHPAIPNTTNKQLLTKIEEHSSSYAQTNALKNQLIELAFASCKATYNTTRRATFVVTEVAPKNSKEMRSVKVRKIDAPTFEEYRTQKKIMRETHRKEEFSKRFPGLKLLTKPFFDEFADKLNEDPSALK